MRKALKYLQSEAAKGTNPAYRSPNIQPHPLRGVESACGDPPEYILVKIQSNSTKPGEVLPEFGVGDLAHRAVLDKHQAAANAVIAAGLEKHQYAYDSILQGYDVYVPELCPGISMEQQKRKIWVVYIHGGYWCNPQELAWTFTATRAMLLTHPSLKKVADQIAGYASLNYRLSPHSDFPQDRRKTSDYEMREAKHPDHINDVLSALRDLQRRHGFGSRYLLLGHGVGATMAMQVAMGRQWAKEGPVLSASVSEKEEEGKPESEESEIKPPIAILGIDGIYDIPLLRNRNANLARYQTMIEGAFGNDEATWAAAGPAGWTRYAETWKEGKLIMLVHSREDELVDWSQVEAMERCWSRGQQEEGEGEGGDEQRRRRVEMMVIREIKGRHAEIWEKGSGMAGAIAEVVGALRLGLGEEQGRIGG